MEKLAASLVLFIAISLPLTASAQTPTASPAPGEGSDGGIIAGIVHASSDAASWLSGRAVEYAGSPLWSTLAGVFVIALIVSLYLWLRRPKKPVEARAPM
jgi:hypothetical protein